MWAVLPCSELNNGICQLFFSSDLLSDLVALGAFLYVPGASLERKLICCFA